MYRFCDVDSDISDDDSSLAEQVEPENQVTQTCRVSWSPCRTMMASSFEGDLACVTVLGHSRAPPPGYEDYKNVAHSGHVPYTINLSGHIGGLTAMAWTMDSQTLVTTCRDSMLRLWDVRGLSAHAAPPSPVLAMHHPDLCITAADCVGTSENSLVVSGGQYGTLCITAVCRFDKPYTGFTCVTSRNPAHDGEVSAVHWEPGVRTLSTIPRFFSTSLDGTYKVWDGERGGGNSILSGSYDKPITCGKWSPCGKRIAMVINESLIAIVDPRQRRAAVSTHSAPCGIRDITWTSGGRSITYEGDDGLLYECSTRQFGRYFRTCAIIRKMAVVPAN